METWKLSKSSHQGGRRVIPTRFIAVVTYFTQSLYRERLEPARLFFMRLLNCPHWQ